MFSTEQRKRLRNGFRRACVGMAVVATGTAFISLPSCQGVLTTFNPCGTVLSFCTAEELDALFSPIPNYNLDPTCSIPFFGLDPANSGVVGTCGTVNVYNTTPGPRPQGTQ
ncbi:MAG TPA: hypothetical protein P5572_13335 [Phycisphaerae bacterium]|nr:hypothetical protein [Phycisphaerales bacterium]HRX85996.1 hypothetical protein [Phycisphaerae bacterium]